MIVEYNGTCGSTGKRKYRERKIALTAIEKTAKYLGEDPLTWDAYVCKQCEEWHVGHIPTQRYVIHPNDETLAGHSVPE